MNNQQTEHLARGGAVSLSPLRALWADESGTTTLEYVLLLALIALSGLVAWQRLGMTAAGSVDGSVGQMGPNSTAGYQASEVTIRPGR